MVCKRSLYCWKNGPCASDQTRKQIWEDNIRFRESLRDTNQSDHYWSFQISKNRCLCLEGEDPFFERPLSRKFRSASLQRLHDIDCTSVTHDCNGLKFRNCFLHCPIHESNNNSGIKRADTPVPLSLVRKENALACMKQPFRSVQRPTEDKSNFCHRYNGSLSNSRLKPSMKTKFLSQTNLSSLSESKNLLERKALHTSCDNIQSLSKNNKSVVKTEKLRNGFDEKKADFEVQTKEKQKVMESANRMTDSEVQTELMRFPQKRDLKLVKKLPNQENVHEFSPISRTTRKMLCEKKKIPFATYGCNNNNLDIGSKRTHNVLASKLEVYPNALTAKQHKRDLIMKYIQSEKEFQKKCFPEEFGRRINHSSLWALDTCKKECKSHQRKSSKHLLPAMAKPLKKISATPSQLDPGYYRTYRKPQVYFY